MKLRQRVLVEGVVQGVGFRPFIYNLAFQNKLYGWVLNSSQGVVIEVEGEEEKLDDFLTRLKTKPPPLARIEKVEVKSLPLYGYSAFDIKSSQKEKEEFLLISPDISTCEACLFELSASSDRRYLYPFTNCTNCGPRFTIIKNMPYDRKNTTMKKFKMCTDCQAEYDNPKNRRFHAQPNACPVCGPKLMLVEGKAKANFQTVLDSKSTDSDLIAYASKLLKDGKIVAIKGLGGFQLACDATSNKVVKTLRERKKRSLHKPFAVMFPSLDAIKNECYLSDEEEEILAGRIRPIVLLQKKEKSTVSELVAPSNRYLGAMLPYTPLHAVLMEEVGTPLVMTSGNISEEPIAMKNEEAEKKLSSISDYLLVHNRDIYSRYDDSVARVIEGEEVLIRRARGYAPYPIHLDFEAQEILAVGPELKNTFCLTRKNFAFVSQHIGDMENLETFNHFKETLSTYKRLFKIKPKIVAYDLHPDYLSTKYAKHLKGLKLVGVQHHHAHIASVLAENGLNEKVIGVSFDGTGYGVDGNIWGGEFLVCDLKEFERVGYLRQVPMPGGEAAIKKPYRMSLSYLYSFFGEGAYDFDLDLFKIAGSEKNLIKKQVEKRINSPLTSSCGRLFDAVSSLIGVCQEVDYEGQAAIELEMVADESIKESYDYQVGSRKSEVGSQKKSSTLSPQLLIVDTQPIVEGVISDLQRKVSKDIISAKFHRTVTLFITDTCKKIRNLNKLNKVALSGGVFQNIFLLTKVTQCLKKEGFEVFTQKKVPPNDGGVSLGQAAIAHFKCSEE